MRPPFSVDIATQIHTRIIEATGGRSGVSDEGLLEAALTSPFQTYGGKDLHSGIVDKASALACGIIRNHPFVDGNKRTAFVLLVTFLRLHRYRLTAAEDEIEETLVSIAAGTCTANQFADWLGAKTSRT